MKRSPSGVAIQFTFTAWGLNQMLIWIWHSDTWFAKLQSLTGSSCESPSSTKPGVVSQGQVMVQATPPATTTRATVAATPRSILLTDVDLLPEAPRSAPMVSPLSDTVIVGDQAALASQSAYSISGGVLDATAGTPPVACESGSEA